ncbi:hypothetical protein WBG78_16475 [Chryseolinea sp. T2]|uniref:hypothetical protein n=1 Tax=Chryseolinea sp. T2 TaxID=3129255 RepID=UPI0030783DB7
MAKFLRRIFIFSLFAAAFYFCFGFFIVQPIGKLKDGSTILYFRLGANGRFISSIDGVLLDNSEDINLVSRMFVLGKLGKVVNERKVASFPYSNTLYLISTNGKDFN